MTNSYVLHYKRYLERMFFKFYPTMETKWFLSLWVFPSVGLFFWPPSMAYNSYYTVYTVSSLHWSFWSIICFFLQIGVCFICTSPYNYSPDGPWDATIPVFIPLWSIMNTHKQYSVYFENSKIAHDFYFDTFLVCFKIWATDAQILQQMTYRRATVPAWECFFSMWNDCNAIAIL